MLKRISKPLADVNLNPISQPSVRSVAATSVMPSKSKVSPEVSRVMAAMGSKGGKIGAKRRMLIMTAAERSEIALHAAKARWAKKRT